ncbi:MAG: hypothetical protein NZM28_09255 [Fimbriimonadales bacterium]|nr:hypothetical protein [Fimbriimonadales bacterium]
MRTAAMGLLLCIICLPAKAQRVGLLGCGESSRDTAYRDALLAQGLTVVWVTPYYEFSAASLLQLCDVATLAPLHNYYDMPVVGQWALENWVRHGGGLVTVEWTLWSRTHGNLFLGLRDLLPASATQFHQQREVRYTLRVHDPTLSAGLAPSLALGFLKEARVRARAGATVFYASDYASDSAGVVGWQVVSGRVVSFSIAAGAGSGAELTNPLVARLLANAVRWAAGDTCTPTRGDANRDGCVDDADLLQALFAFGATGANTADANCDGIVDDADLLEVLFQFGAGC